jgi:hypothetical protein
VEPAVYEQWGRAVVERAAALIIAEIPRAAADLSSQVVQGLRRAGLID